MLSILKKFVQFGKRTSGGNFLTTCMWILVEDPGMSILYIYILSDIILYILCYYYYYYHYYCTYIIIYFYILILSYYCITIFLYYHILYYCITILLYYHILSYYYTQTPRFSQAQNSANTREFCTTSSNGKELRFNYVARMLTSVAYTYQITRTFDTVFPTTREHNCEESPIGAPNTQHEKVFDTQIQADREGVWSRQ